MSRLLILPLLATLALMGCAGSSTDTASSTPAEQTALTMADLDPALADTAIFAGGCFWCMEPPFDKIEGVAATISGFAGGTVPNPSYRRVVQGGTGHTEVIQIIYDASQVDFGTLLQVYWRNVDPFDAGGQFCDRGDTYRPEIFALNAEQQAQAEASKQAIAQRFDQPLVVDITPTDTFYPAEDYHQNFYKTNPDRYYSYRIGCRRDARLEQIWGDEAGGDAFIASANGE
ncbi:MAG: peptide-methionine (S)-S-oxide reductase MsrA [Bacteroidota bacterium]